MTDRVNNSQQTVYDLDRDQFAQVYVQQFTIRNFRGLNNCTIEFEPDLTLLVGCNNAGKSRLLRALAIAAGATVAERDDLTVTGPNEATIDIILAPAKSHGNEEVFDERVARRLGSSIQALSDEPTRERFAWRTTIRPSREGFGVRAESTILFFDQAAQLWQQPSNPSSLSGEQRSIVAADLVETRRDLVEELSRRGSPIRRILDDLEIEYDERVELEKGLQNLNEGIVSSSKSLEALKKALDILSRSIDTMGLPSLHPLPIRLEELARSVSIDLDTGAGSLPMRFQGAGARSLASLQIQGVLYDRRLGRDGPALRPHPLSLIEEPEVHLHPQAQFELPALLDQMRGQVIVSTHSTHVVSVADPRSIRVLKRSENGTSVIDLRPDYNKSAPRSRRPSMHFEEMEKIRRLVERPFGELLFASAVILGDGATERALLPPLVRHVLKDRAHGICVVDPGSMGSEYAIAIVKFANLLEFPWILFSDSDPSGTAAAKRLVRDHSEGDMSRIVWVPSEPTKSGDRGGATERMFLDFDRDLCVAACSPLGFDPMLHDDDLLGFMKGHKGAIGRLLAAELIVRHPWCTDSNEEGEIWPKALCNLITKLGTILPW
jgi:putative ATP-dependent endonuclease of OLD family